MNDHTPHPLGVAAGAVLLGGLFVGLFPQHAGSVLLIVVMTVAVAAGLYVLGAYVPPAGWMSPFRWMSPFADTDAARSTGAAWDHLHAIRRKFRGRRQAIAGGMPLPPAVVRLLRPLIGAALDLDPASDADVEAARQHLSPATWAVFREKTERGPAWLRSSWPDERAVAGEVERILDELDDLVGITSHHSQDFRHRPGL